uniref:Uncharacterized protein n=1 Tax=Streptomyces ambofaciens (strain ATCC 23877 / 3486 / DSM 40053 / JCM 4204 / NBRC 12836 / NRRL B-2516) TaxID=278992 RepID=A3KKE0_STRA7|nr:hypothetical protein SAML1190 [Streptomyces ambofaciens ATCC 23877]
MNIPGKAHPAARPGSRPSARREQARFMATSRRPPAAVSEDVVTSGETPGPHAGAPPATRDGPRSPGRWRTV